MLSTKAADRQGKPLDLKQGATIQGYYNVLTHEINMDINFNMMNVHSDCFLQKVDKHRIDRFDEEVKRYQADRPLDVRAGMRWGQMNQRNYKNPTPTDFPYMFDKNSDRPNLQAWLSAGAKHVAWTSQTDVWYSSSDAFYLYQAKHDSKTYTKEANPFLPHDTTLVSSADRPPLGIEGKEHLSVAQKLYYEPSKHLSLQLYGSAFFMNSYDLLQDMNFSQSRDYMAGLKLRYDVKNWFSIHLSLHGDFYDRFKRHERMNLRKKVYQSTISFHTYVVRTADGKRYFKLQIVSWYHAEVEIGDSGGRISYYLDELKE